MKLADLYTALALYISHTGFYPVYRRFSVTALVKQYRYLVIVCLAADVLSGRVRNIHKVRHSVIHHILYGTEPRLRNTDNRKIVIPAAEINAYRLSDYVRPAVCFERYLIIDNADILRFFHVIFIDKPAVYRLHRYYFIGFFVYAPHHTRNIAFDKLTLGDLRHKRHSACHSA